MVSTRSRTKQGSESIKNANTKSKSLLKRKKISKEEISVSSVPEDIELFAEKEKGKEKERGKKRETERKAESGDEGEREKRQEESDGQKEFDDFYLSSKSSLMSSPPSTFNYFYMIITIVIFALFTRHLVSLHPHSGQDQGQMYGDYEAQRHWMEITVNLPLHQWYVNGTDNDLNYWGIDYPPLSCYISWIIGSLSKVLDPPSMVLYESRGYETKWHKAMIMRLSVIVTDIICYIPSIYCISSLLALEYFPPLLLQNRNPNPNPIKNTNTSTNTNANANTNTYSNENQNQNQARNSFFCHLSLFLLQLLQPGLLLIDHGHFQYNSTCFGLSLLGLYFLTKEKMMSRILASVFFSFALNMKHIALYYAPVFFFSLLRRSYDDMDSGAFTSVSLGNTASFSPSPSASGVNVESKAASKSNPKSRLQRSIIFLEGVCYYGLTVILVFALMWGPFCYYEENQQCLRGLGHVLTRLFPLKRNIFEDKVANFWYTISRITDVRRKFKEESLAIMALAITLLALFPSSLMILLYPAGKTRTNTVHHGSNVNEQHCYHQRNIHQSLALTTLTTTQNPKKAAKNKRSLPRRMIKKDQDKSRDRDPSILVSANLKPCGITQCRSLLLALINASLSFFLFAFQVHEKSLLFTLIPVSFFILEDPHLICWINVLGNFSMFPLLLRDKLIIPYIGCNLIYYSLSWIIVLQMKKRKMKIPSLIEELEVLVNMNKNINNNMDNMDNMTMTIDKTETTKDMYDRNKRGPQSQKEIEKESQTKVSRGSGILFMEKLADVFLSFCRKKSSIRSYHIFLSYLIMLIIHLFHLFVPPPDKLPDIYPLLYSVYSALNFGIIYLYMNLLQVLLTYYRYYATKG